MTDCLKRIKYCEDCSCNSPSEYCEYCEIEYYKTEDCEDKETKDFEDCEDKETEDYEDCEDCKDCGDKETEDCEDCEDCKDCGDKETEDCEDCEDCEELKSDSGSTDSGSTDSGSTDSGSEDSGSEDSGSEDSGSEEIKDLVENLRKRSVEEKEDRLDREVKRIRKYLKKADNYEIITIKNGVLLSTEYFGTNEPDCLSPKISLPDGDYIRFSILKNSFVDLDELKSRLNDSFYYVELNTTISEFSTEMYYDFYIQCV